ncbi:hypothetical protein ACFW6N_22905 [Streptomyces cyaneofuscatus]
MTSKFTNVPWPASPLPDTPPQPPTSREPTAAAEPAPDAADATASSPG